MSIEELQAKQRKFEKWEATSKGLCSALEPALKKAPAEAARLSGLKLRAFHDPGPYMPAHLGGFSVRGERCFWLLADGTNARAEVSTMACSVAASVDGKGYAYRFSGGDKNQKLGLEVTLKDLAVPLTVSHYSWVCNLWWHGPPDNHKLAETIVDALAKSARASEFSLKPISPPRSQPSYGCLLALLAVALLVVYTIWSS